MPCFILLPDSSHSEEALRCHVQVDIELFHNRPLLRNIRLARFPQGPSSLLPSLHAMADAEQNSRSSHEDAEKGSRVDLNANISARSVHRCRRGGWW